MKEESGGKKVDQFCERENIVFDSLIYLEPVERFKNRSNVMKFRSFGDSTLWHSQLLVGACCVCKCFICLLKVNNLQVFFVSFWHVLAFCFGTCMPFGCLLFSNKSFIHSFIHSFIQSLNCSQTRNIYKQVLFYSTCIVFPVDCAGCVTIVLQYYFFTI